MFSSLLSTAEGAGSHEGGFARSRGPRGAVVGRQELAPHGASRHERGDGRGGRAGHGLGPVHGDGLVGARRDVPLPEVVWWPVLLGVVVACVLATVVALRLWESGMEGLRGSGYADRDRGLRGRVSTPPADADAVVGPEEKHAERRLLEAIDRHGQITPVRAALETPLTVAEADRMLSDLAKGGHLQVRVEGGKLLYGL
jgi:hypothetical protein